ncbi:MAG: hypothetical protein JW767_04465 [Thermoleophilia bacterium]|nr:hypothetical protein [Thermoleophilia bacterium]
MLIAGGIQNSGRGPGRGGLARRALLSLVVLALLAWTLQSLVLSGANFAGNDVSAGHTFTAGSVSHTNSHAGAFIIDVEPFRPGAVRTQAVTLTGGPDVPAAYTVSRLSVVDEPASPSLSSVLQLRIEDVTGATQVLYEGALADFTVANLGVLADGDQRVLQFTLTYPAASATRELQGASTLVEFEFVGVSL